MKKLIVQFALSLALTASIINLSFSTYNRVADKPVEKHKIVIAPWYPIAWIFILANGVWKKVNGHPRGRPENKPSTPEKHSKGC